MLLLQRQATRRSSSLYHDERDDVNAKASFVLLSLIADKRSAIRHRSAPRVERTGDDRSHSILTHADHRRPLPLSPQGYPEHSEGYPEYSQGYCEHSQGTLSTQRVLSADAVESPLVGVEWFDWPFGVFAIHDLTT
jgi:hypothetical protein